MNRGVVVVSLVPVDLGPVLEKFVQDTLLLVVVNIHTFALNGTATRLKLMLPLAVLVVVAWRVPRLHTL